MTAEQLEELLEYFKDDTREYRVFKMADVLSNARRVLAAEKLVLALEGVKHYVDGYAGSDEQDALDSALTAYREASK